ncbi:beta-microseminoprotein [Labrus bergylta]|uniref:beta-microseminoprotein n=1 Tax=Labrus bergylta TaxID=56723 RepID=UPI0010FB5110|nr:beta-microseminoprotein J1-like [Labrus bergylta]
MKCVALSLMLCALLSMSNAQCYSKALKPGMTHCQDDTDMTWHAVGSNWRNSECMDCSCSGCCAAYSTPRSFPDDCVSVFDPVACEYKVFKRNNPTVQCMIFGAVGK